MTKEEIEREAADAEAAFIAAVAALRSDSTQEERMAANEIRLRVKRAHEALQKEG